MAEGVGEKLIDMATSLANFQKAAVEAAGDPVHVRLKREGRAMIGTRPDGQVIWVEELADGSGRVCLGTLAGPGSDSIWSYPNAMSASLNATGWLLRPQSEKPGF